MDHDLTTAWMVLKVLGGGGLSFSLRPVEATSALGSLSFVRPLAIGPLRDVPSLSWHRSSKRSNVCTWQTIPGSAAEPYARQIRPVSSLP